MTGHDDVEERKGVCGRGRPVTNGVDKITWSQETPDFRPGRGGRTRGVTPVY